MTEEIIIDECFNCKKKKDIGDNWRTCKLKCSYKYKRKENDYVTRLEQENKELKEKVKSRENELANMAEQANMRINNYRSALEEIKQIALDSYSTGTHTSCENGLKEIEDKINEVLQ